MPHESVLRPWFQKLNHRTVKGKLSTHFANRARRSQTKPAVIFFQSKEMSLEKFVKDPYGILAASAVVGIVS